MNIASPQTKCARPLPTDNSLSRPRECTQTRPPGGCRGCCRAAPRPPEQRLLLFHGTGVEYGDLDKQEIVAPVDAEIGASLLPVQPLRPGQIQIGGPRQRRAPPDLPRGNKFGAAIQGANSQRIAGRPERPNRSGCRNPGRTRGQSGCRYPLT